MNAPELLRELSERLGLMFEPQDWGICNASGSRLAEFIQFYESNELADTQRFEMGELIIASANELLVRQGNESAIEVQRFGKFIQANRELLGAHLNYWKNLESDTEFPIAKFLSNI